MLKSCACAAKKLLEGGRGDEVDFSLAIAAFADL